MRLTRSLPLDHPERCAAFQAVEEEYMDKVYFMPIRWVGGVKWVVQPWGGRLREYEQSRHQHDALDVRPAALDADERMTALPVDRQSRDREGTSAVGVAAPMSYNCLPNCGESLMARMNSGYSNVANTVLGHRETDSSSAHGSDCEIRGHREL